MILKNFSTTVFVGQPEYFRQNYYDATVTGQHFAFDITSGDLSVLKELPAFLKQKNAKICVMIRPEWLANFPDVFDAIKKMGIKVVGYATEPIPLDGMINPHDDLLLRKDNLKFALNLDWDLLVFFDKSSQITIREMGFKRAAYHLLPVSHLLFKPRAKEKVEFDALFIGRFTEYRESFLMPLKVSKKIVHIAHGLHDEWASFLMKRSKCVINIHNHSYLNFETRVIQSLLCEKPTLTEPLTQNLIDSHELVQIFTSPQELYRLVDELENNDIYVKDRKSHTDLLEKFHVNSFFTLLGEKL